MLLQATQPLQARCLKTDDQELHSKHIPASSPHLHTGEGAFSFSGLRQGKTAVLLDGGFVRKRFSQRTGRKLSASDVGQFAQGLLDSHAEELFRIYFYDCAPSDVTTTHPITGKAAGSEDHAGLSRKYELPGRPSPNRTARLSRGELVFRGWRLTSTATQDLIRNGIVDRIVLCTGDRDFVPAMKLARREGVQVVLATLGATVHPTLLEHTDFVRRVEPTLTCSPAGG